MRIAVLFAASLLLAGCSQAQDSRPGATRLTPISPSHSPSATRSTATTAPTTAAPAPGVPVAAALAWIQGAGPIDAAGFHVALRNGTSTPLADDVAFTTASGTTCMTDTKRGAGLACLVNLTDPPPQPPDVYGVWKGGWVDYDGTSVQVGSAHGDPGRFALGQGSPLPQDRSLSFGDFRCRTDGSTLVCGNFAHQTAVRYNDDGIDTYGCTRTQQPAAGIGIQYRC
ncbi:MAG: hypothetical protein ACR2JI_02625 [Mycobacterium sp.]